MKHHWSIRNQEYTMQQNDTQLFFNLQKIWTSNGLCPLGWWWWGGVEFTKNDTHHLVNSKSSEPMCVPSSGRFHKKWHPFVFVNSKCSAPRVKYALRGCFFGVPRNHFPGHLRGLGCSVNILRAWGGWLRFRKLSGTNKPCRGFRKWEARCSSTQKFREQTGFGNSFNSWFYTREWIYTKRNCCRHTICLRRFWWE